MNVHSWKPRSWNFFKRPSHSKHRYLESVRSKFWLESNFGWNQTPAGITVYGWYVDEDRDRNFDSINSILIRADPPVELCQNWNRREEWFQEPDQVVQFKNECLQYKHGRPNGLFVHGSSVLWIVVTSLVHLSSWYKFSRIDSEQSGSFSALLPLFWFPSFFVLSPVQSHRSISSFLPFSITGFCSIVDFFQQFFRLISVPGSV